MRQREAACCRVGWDTYLCWLQFAARASQKSYSALRSALSKRSNLNPHFIEEWIATAHFFALQVGEVSKWPSLSFKGTTAGMPSCQSESDACELAMTPVRLWKLLNGLPTLESGTI